MSLLSVSRKEESDSRCVTFVCGQSKAVLIQVDDAKIACYKNKVQEWRNGVETNIDDVLQIANVFVNVSKGELAKHQDLQKAFGKTDTNEIVKEVRTSQSLFTSILTNTMLQILKKGELQVGEKEREHDLSSIRREIATLVAEKCVDPATQRPIPVGMIEKAMTEAGYSVRPGKNAKSQVALDILHRYTEGALKIDGQVSECIKLLQSDSTLPIQRARMRVKVTMPSEDGKRIRKRILEGAEKVETDAMGDQQWEAVSLDIATLQE